MENGKAAGNETEKKTIAAYLYKNRWIFILSFLFFILAYMTWIVNPTPRIDGEILINTPYYSSGYLERGQGNLLTEYVFASRWFNPLFSTVISFIFMYIGTMILGYLAYQAGIDKRVSAFLGIIMLMSPIMIELFYFDMLLFKASWAYILVFLSAGFTLYAKGRIKWVCWVTALLLLYWAISTYEAFAGVYATVIVFLYLAKYYTERKEGEIKTRKSGYPALILRSVLILGGAIILNTIISRLFSPNENTYLTAKVLWNQQPIAESLHGILSIIKKGMLGESLFYTPFMIVLSVGVPVAALIHVLSRKRRLLDYLFLLICVVLQVCPYLMGIVLGGYSDAIRTQLTYPLVIAMDIALLFMMCNKKILKAGLALLTACIVWTMSQTTMRLEYTDQIRAKEDLFVANEMIHKIDQECDNAHTPIFIIGTYTNRLNGACQRGEMIGTSIFGYADFLSPAYFYSSLRTMLVLKTLGIERNSLTDHDLTLEARKTATEMPSYPLDGCVKKTDKYIIFKLSEDEYPAELE